MIEYLYNTIRATANEEITIAAKITDATGSDINSGCHLSIFDGANEKLITVDGTVAAGIWEFTIPAEATAELKGKYWYCICCNNTHRSYNFKQPIYFI